MIDNHSSDRLPKLSFSAPETVGTGIEVHELELAPFGIALAPFKANRSTVEPDCSSPVDSHLVREMWFIAQGEGELVYDNRSVRIRAGDACYFEPLKAHSVRNDGTETLVVFSIWWS